MKKFDVLGRSLSKMEQKVILGGLYGDDGGGGCSTNECRLVVQWGPVGGQGWTTYHGTCASSSSGCYCNTAYYDTQVPVTSNGGVSRCTI